jgi:hypothetical protein
MHSIRASQYENSAYLRYAITYGRYAASRNSAAKGSAQRTCLSPCSVRRTKRMEACAECDLETEYTLLDELKVVNGIRVDVVAEKASANQPGAPLAEREPFARHPKGDLSPPSCKTNQSDYDWAENSVLELARQIQSQYWGRPSRSGSTQRDMC